MGVFDNCFANGILDLTVSTKKKQMYYNVHLRVICQVI